MKKIFWAGFHLWLLFALQAGAQQLDRSLYVLNGWGANSLSRMNLETGTISDDFLTGIGSVPTQLISFNNRLYVLNSVPDEIKIIDPLDAAAPLRSIALVPGANPWHMAFISLTEAYVTNLLDASVNRVDLKTGELLARIDVASAPEGILVSNNEAWITSTALEGWSSYGQGSVSLIDTGNDSVLATLPLPTNPQVIAQAPDPSGWGGTYLHVLCTGNYADIPGKIAVINRWAPPDYAPAVVDTIEIGGQPGDIVITPEGKGYCCAWGDDQCGYLYIYDALTNTILRGTDNFVPVGRGASRLLYDPEEKCLWIANQVDATIQKFDLSRDTVSATYPFTMSTMDMALVGPLGQPDAWADEAVSFTPGTNAGFGQNYYPNNILGPPDPDPAVNATNPSNKPQEILSLGNGGEIILAFMDNHIVDGEGPDFTVFENAFQMWNGSIFRETAIVSVSQDGLQWTTFPWDTASLSGLAGCTPTLDNQHPDDPSRSGGDSFNLADLGLAWIAYVKLDDMGDRWQEPFGAGDFDLDAVVAVNSEAVTGVMQKDDATPAGFDLAENFPNPFNPLTTIAFTTPCPARVSVTVYDIGGRIVKTLLESDVAAGQHQTEWNATDRNGRPVSSGVYIYRLDSGEHHLSGKMLLVR